MHFDCYYDKSPLNRTEILILPAACLESPCVSLYDRSKAWNKANYWKTTSHLQLHIKSPNFICLQDYSKCCLGFKIKVANYTHIKVVPRTIIQAEMLNFCNIVVLNNERGCKKMLAHCRCKRHILKIYAALCSQCQRLLKGCRFWCWCKCELTRFAQLPTKTF